MPSVTILMRVYNAERYLREAIESALAQTYTDFELLVIDDGSTDASPDILREFTDERLRVVRQPNAGKIPAASRGLAEARGKFVAILDADDRSRADRLALQVGYLEANPDVVLVGSALGIVDEHGARVGVRRYPLDDAAIRRTATLYNPFGHSSIVFRRNAARAAGGYSPRFVPEDYDLNLRLMRFGRVANLAETLSDYRIRTGPPDARHLKFLLRGTIEMRRAALREYGLRRTPAATLADLAQRALMRAPSPLVNWMFAKMYYRRA